MRAIDVMYAVHVVLLNAFDGDVDLAKGKTNRFLRRAGADMYEPPEQPLDPDRVKETAHEMLDIDCEKQFWENLKKVEESVDDE